MRFHRNRDRFPFFKRSPRCIDDFADHFETYKKVVEFAKILDTKYIRMFSFYTSDKETDKSEVFARLEKMIDYAKENDIVLLHENEKKIYGDTADFCLELMQKFYCDNFKAIFDPANFVQCGQDTLEAWEMLRPYVHYLHIKDANESGQMVPAGEGCGNIPIILKKYYEMGGRDLTLEPHLFVFDGLKELEKDFDVNEIGERETYPTARAAFDAAVVALDGLIKRI